MSSTDVAVSPVPASEQGVTSRQALKKSYLRLHHLSLAQCNYAPAAGRWKDEGKDAAATFKLSIRFKDYPCDVRVRALAQVFRGVAFRDPALSKAYI